MIGVLAIAIMVVAVLAIGVVVAIGRIDKPTNKE
jgi:hypothetical protein